MSGAMRIDVYADIVCPWCYIGERRLESALAQRPELEVEFHWRPFQLRPEMPPQGEPWERLITEKFGGPERARAMFAHVSAAGAPDGVEFAWDRIASAPNTRDAHRLVLLAAEQGRERAMAESLFRGYFAEGALLNDPETLVGLAVRAGVDAGAARELLRGERNVEEVADSQKEAQRLGVTGVPMVVLDGRYAVSGAQPVEVFVRALDTAAAGVAEG
jgi:predicted DsbA family dithiol-disulfide isomerase